ncbi:MAG: polysaccharide deacetylase family protein [Flavobacteriaceae bacterium]
MMKKSIMYKSVIALCFTLLIASCAKKKKSNENKEMVSSPIEQANEEPNTWAQKLGWPADKKVIMLHADDIGMCPEANTAAKTQLTEGVIQSAAVMIPCPNAHEFISWAKERPALDVGLHLTLTSEWQTYRWGTVSQAEQVPGLLDEHKKMWHEVPEVVQHASAEEVEKEVRAQIEQSMAWGHKPTHIDTHMGTLYGHPSYVKVFIDIAEEYSIPANIIDISKPEVMNEFKSQGYPLDDTVLQLVTAYTLPKLDYFTSVGSAKTYEDKIADFKTLVQNLKPGLTEIIFHPSELTENLKDITNSWQQRSWEAQMFSDPDLIQFFKDEGIIFTNWKEIMQRFEAR